MTWYGIKAPNKHNPKKRYEIMTKDMPLGGKLSLDMMYRTCGTQLNIDYSSEDDFTKSDVIAVMAVDNLPCELPKDASEDFGAEMIKHILPCLLKQDSEKVITRATICENGNLTEYYQYLNNYAFGKL